MSPRTTRTRPAPRSSRSSRCVGPWRRVRSLLVPSACESPLRAPRVPDRCGPRRGSPRPPRLFAARPPPWFVLTGHALVWVRAWRVGYGKQGGRAIMAVYCVWLKWRRLIGNSMYEEPPTNPTRLRFCVAAVFLFTMTHVAHAICSNAECDDGNPCNGVETCQGDVCVPAPPLDCDDHDGCTFDGCDVFSGCRHIPLIGCTTSTTLPGSSCLADVTQVDPFDC